VDISDSDNTEVRTTENLFTNTIILSRLHERQEAERRVCALKSCGENGKISFIIGRNNYCVNLRCCHASQVAELRRTGQKNEIFYEQEFKTSADILRDC
jgi:hypothetical protein